MEAWPKPVIPRLPGTGQSLRLFNTATQSIEVSSPGPEARMYVCGITPYDATHIGHANTYVAFDLINRVWRDSGLNVHYVQNVTDIDDPLLERAVATGQDWRAIADRETALFREDMEQLNVLPPEHYIGAVESIPSVAEYVEQLQASGHVYAVDDDLYFKVRNDPKFGQVGRLSDEEMRAIFGQRGGDPDRQGKHDPLDCLVWQSARPDEPAWDTVLGHGRPGWHIECAAIALEFLGKTIDVQGGGSDLIFPHHEMSASEAQLITGEPIFARNYVHSGMVSWQGHKMSKSRGNLVFVSTLRHEGVDPRAIRLALLAHHYRSDWTWTPHGLDGAQERLQLWLKACELPQAPDVQPLITRMRDHLANDLRTPEALDAIDTYARTAIETGGDDSSAPALFADTTDALLGINLR